MSHREGETGASSQSHRIHAPPSLGPKTMLGNSKNHSSSPRDPVMSSPIASEGSREGVNGEYQPWGNEMPTQRLQGVFKSRGDNNLTDDFASLFYGGGGESSTYNNLSRPAKSSGQGGGNDHVTIRKPKSSESAEEKGYAGTDFLRQTSTGSESNASGSSEQHTRRTSGTASTRREGPPTSPVSASNPQHSTRRKVLRYTAPQLLGYFEELDPPSNLPEIPAVTTSKCLKPASFTPFDPTDILRPWQQQMKGNSRARPTNKREQQGTQQQPLAAGREGTEEAEAKEPNQNAWRSNTSREMDLQGVPGNEKAPANQPVQDPLGSHQAGNDFGDAGIGTSFSAPMEDFNYALFGTAFENTGSGGTDMSTFLQQMTNSITAEQEAPKHLNNESSMSSVAATNKPPGLDDSHTQTSQNRSSWYYRDPQGNIQGPFTADNMRVWLQAGYFKPELPIRRGESGEFFPLSDFFPNLQNAFIEDPHVKQAQNAGEAAQQPSPTAVPELHNVEQQTQHSTQQLAQNIQAAHRQLNNWLAEHSNAISQYHQLEQTISSLQQSDHQYRQALSQCTTAIQSIKDGTYQQLPPQQQERVKQVASQASSYYNATQEIQKSLQNKLALRNDLSKKINERANLIEAGKLQIARAETELQQKQQEERGSSAASNQFQKGLSRMQAPQPPPQTTHEGYASSMEPSETQFSPLKYPAKSEGFTSENQRTDWREETQTMKQMLHEKMEMQKQEQKQKEEEERRRHQQELESQRRAAWGNAKPSQPAKPIKEQFREQRSSNDNKQPSTQEPSSGQNTESTESRSLYTEIFSSSAGWTSQPAKGNVKSLLEIQREEAAKQQAFEEKERQERLRATAEADKRSYQAVRDSKPHTPSAEAHTLGRGSVHVSLATQSEQDAWNKQTSQAKPASNKPNEGLKSIQQIAKEEQKKEQEAQQQKRYQQAVQAAHAAEKSPWGTKPQSAQPNYLKQIQEAQKQATEKNSVAQNRQQTAAPRATGGMTMAERLKAQPPAASSWGVTPGKAAAKPAPSQRSQGSIWGGEQHAQANPPPAAARSVKEQRAQKQAPNVPVSAPQKTSFAATTEETNFWDEVARPSNAAASKPKKNDNKPAAQSGNEFGGQGMSKPFQDWCQAEMKKLTGSKDLTLPHFCMTLETSAEIRTYLTTYLGNSESVQKFAADFVANKEADSTSSGWTQPQKKNKKR